MSANKELPSLQQGITLGINRNAAFKPTPANGLKTNYKSLGLTTTVPMTDGEGNTMLGGLFKTVSGAVGKVGNTVSGAVGKVGNVVSGFTSSPNTVILPGNEKIAGGRRLRRSSKKRTAHKKRTHRRSHKKQSRRKSRRSRK
jgi:hypothetical protein